MIVKKRRMKFFLRIPNGGIATIIAPALFIPLFLTDYIIFSRVIQKTINKIATFAR